MTQPFVSITVPVYRTERDLSRCLDSLINQTLQNIEIILVDDGSPDRCGEICDEYAAKDSRIRVFHKENGGLGSARKLGLENCTGKYYTVCDSDDWVEPNMYEELYAKAEKEDADIVICDYFNEYGDSKQIRSTSYTFTSQEQFIEDLMLRKTSVNTWCKLFRLSKIREFGIDYTPGINLGEDGLFLFKLLRYPVKVSSLNRAFYHYQRDMNGLSYTNNISLNSIANAEYLHNWKMENYTEKRYYRAHLFSLVNLAFLALRSKDINNELYDSITKRLSIAKMLRYRVISLKSMLIVGTKLFGLQFGQFMLRILYKAFYK